MYSRFVKILKFLQLLGYVGAIIFAAFYSFFITSFGFSINKEFYVVVIFLVFATFLCFTNYIGTQTIIAIIDLLNRIETNTRNMRRD